LARRRRNRVYCDTSVFGGVFDDEFAAASRQFFKEVRRGLHQVLLSEITARELRRAPGNVKRFVARLPKGGLLPFAFTAEMSGLRDAYLKAHAVSQEFSDDAAHVAGATIVRADLIVSWNFRHLVKWERIQAFNDVNRRLGFPSIAILSPREVVQDEEEV